MIGDTYREGNLKFLEMMISQINDFIENTRHGDGPKSYVIDEDEINKKLCSTNKLAYLLATGVGNDQLPNNEDIYSMDFFESIKNYLDTKYKYEFYNVYTLMEMRGDLQRIYDDYNKRGYLPWDNKKEEAEMKESIVKGDRSGNKTNGRLPLNVVEYTVQFDIDVHDFECDMPYILEMTNPDGSFERRVIVITTMSIQRINYTYWEAGFRVMRDTLLPSSFCGDNAYKLYKITGEDLK
jgi:hypothetical protein